MRKQNDWANGATDLDGPRFAEFQIGLTNYNKRRFEPGLPEDTPVGHLRHEARIAEAEIAFVKALRKAIAPLTANIPSEVNEFIAWFERLKETGPGQGDQLFPWLATEASLEQSWRWRGISGTKWGAAREGACTGQCLPVLPTISRFIRHPTSSCPNRLRSATP